MLVNVNMVDLEHAERNVMLKKGKAGYRPYDDEEEMDEYGMVCDRLLLSVLMSVLSSAPL